MDVCVCLRLRRTLFIDLKRNIFHSQQTQKSGIILSSMNIVFKTHTHTETERQRIYILIDAF